MTVRYAAVMEQADAGGFGVWFPDFPGCVSHGEDPMHASQAARRALSRHIEGLVEDGAMIPRPTPAEVSYYGGVAGHDSLGDVTYTRLDGSSPSMPGAADCDFY